MHAMATPPIVDCSAGHLVPQPGSEGLTMALRSPMTRPFRSGAVKPAAFALSALTVLMSAAVASAATTQGPRLGARTAANGQAGGHAPALPRSATSLTWHPLKLINGWTRYSDFEAAPSYAISGGVVYLRGQMVQQVSGANDFAVLPHAAWPSHVLHRAVEVAATSAADLQIIE